MKHTIRCAFIVVGILACQSALAIDRAAIDQAVAGLAVYSPEKSAQAVADVRKTVRETAGDAAMRAYLEEKLIGVLEGEKSSLEARVKTCEAIWIMGSPKSLGVLERMLADAKDSHLACYAIGRQPSVAAGEVLARGLGLAKGRAAVNILNVMGSRGEAGQWQAIGKRVRDPDEAVVQAALGALAKLGTQEAYGPIIQVRAGLKGESRRPADLALMEWAERAAALGHVESARKVYAVLMRPENDAVIRRGAVAGLVALPGPEWHKALADVTQGNEPEVAKSAIAAAIRAHRAGAAEWLGGHVNLPSELAVAFAEGYGRAAQTEGEKAAGRSAARPVGANGDTAVRQAVIGMLARIGDESDVPQILGFMDGAAGADLAAQGRSALVGLGGGAKTDAAIVVAMKEMPPGRRALLIKVLAERFATSATPALLNEAVAAEPEVARAAVEALGAVAAPGELPAVLGVMVGAKDEEVRRAAELAAIAVAVRATDQAARAEPVMTAYRTEKDSAGRASLARVLGGVGGQGALDVLKGAVTDSETAVSDAALRALAGWQDISAVPALLEVARQGDEKDVRRAIALRGALRQLGDGAVKSKGPAGAEVADGFVAAAALVKSADEKRLLLSGVSQLRDAKAVGIVEKYLDDAEVGAEARLAAAKVAQNVEANDPAGAKRLRGK